MDSPAKEYILTREQTWRYYYRTVSVVCESCISYELVELGNDEEADLECGECGEECIQAPYEGDFDA